MENRGHEPGGVRPMTLKVAIIGDVHGLWTDADRRWFEQSDYQLVLFVGDLATFRDDGREVARHIARLGKPTLLMPGNHDGISLPHLAAETVGPRALVPLLSLTQHSRRRRFAEAAHPLALCGYCSHPVNTAFGEVTFIGGRPHSNGGPTLAFRSMLERLYEVDSLESSAERLERLVDDATDDIVFFAHNGPTGLGDRRDDLWGCDFKLEEGDWGDPDLGRAIAYARAQGKRVRAVVAGHMHQRLKGGGLRRWRERRDDTLFVNAARVPRVERPNLHHHVSLTLTDDTSDAEPIVVVL